MSWAIGYDKKWKRDIGYRVPALCDYPDCEKQIDRGLDYVCGKEPFGGEHGCGLYFCYEHLYIVPRENTTTQLCLHCKQEDCEEFKPKPDVNEWLQHKLTDESWQAWRDENPRDVTKIKKFIWEQKSLVDKLEYISGNPFGHSHTLVSDLIKEAIAKLREFETKIKTIEE